jgi:PIN domain nuclease of toxin-antitoxin system
LRILLDTHAWLWMESAPERLRPAVQAQVADPVNQLFVSSASVWEIAIKYATGKLRLDQPPSEYVPSRMLRTLAEALPISHAHALRAGALPPHHKDPFDRLLIAQAQIERLPILTADPAFAAYDVEVIAA